MSSMPALWPALAASKSSPAPPAMKSSPAPATSSSPSAAWTDWQPLKDGAVASPAGRFLQWKAVLHADGVVGSVGVNYLPVNAAPVIDDLVVATGARVNPQSSGRQPAADRQHRLRRIHSCKDGTTTDSTASAPLTAAKDRTAVTVRWAAHDDNGDDLIYSLYLRGDGETVWRLLKDKITDKACSFDATLIPDGGYQVKVVASDCPFAHPRRRPHRRESQRPLRGRHHAAGNHRAQGRPQHAPAPPRRAPTRSSSPSTP